MLISIGCDIWGWYNVWIDSDRERWKGSQSQTYIVSPTKSKLLLQTFSFKGQTHCPSLSKESNLLFIKRKVLIYIYIRTVYSYNLLLTKCKQKHFFLFAKKVKLVHFTLRNSFHYYFSLCKRILLYVLSLRIARINLSSKSL